MHHPKDNNRIDLSRRGLLQSSVGGALLSGASSDSAETGFTPGTQPRRLSENLYVLEDTCNVYVVRSGSSAVLIDFGSGAILDHLSALGITSVAWILHTHHHRDQAQGDGRAVEAGIPIAVPEHEHHLFEAAENFWRNRQVFELYWVRNDFFSLTRDIPVTALLRDYTIFKWDKYEFLIQPTPGHTAGSITLVSTIDENKVAFSGDLMHSPGKVQTLYDLQYYYGEHEGVDLSAYSLAELIKLKPDLLCPSHGDPLSNPTSGMQELIAKLRDWYGFWHPGGGFTLDNEPRLLTPHVVAHWLPTSSFYAIISDTGKALFIDYGAASWNFFLAFKDAVSVHDHFRFIEHSIGTLRTRYGLKSIDVAIPSHMHDDHLHGFPHLKKRYGTEIWAFENMVDILQNPKGRNLGCTFGQPLEINRVLHHRETFRWEEFEFTALHSPGHTNYEMALFTIIDGARIAFTGDAFFHDADRPNQIRHNLIYRNQVKLGDYIQSIQNVLDFEPQIIAPGHGQPFLVDRQMAEDFKAKMKRQDDFFRSLIADPDTNLGLDPAWVEIFPYQSTARPGQTLDYELRLRNHRSRPISLQARLVLPPGWTHDPQLMEFTVDPGASRATAFRVSIPKSWRGKEERLAIAADVLAGNKYLGQIAEAVVDIARVPAGPSAAQTA
jgi:glyoxylase-like metal-dependent hydrolase (beta-lactamase superfamily II)